MCATLIALLKLWAQECAAETANYFNPFVMEFMIHGKGSIEIRAIFMNQLWVRVALFVNQKTVTIYSKNFAKTFKHKKVHKTSFIPQTAKPRVKEPLFTNTQAHLLPTKQNNATTNLLVYYILKTIFKLQIIHPWGLAGDPTPRRKVGILLQRK